MKLFLPNKKIEFYSTVEGVPDTNPITRISDNLPLWHAREKQEYLANSTKNPSKRDTYLYRCPGISGLFSQGFVVPMWFDLNITTNGDRKDFKYSIASSYLENILIDRPLVDAHNQVAKNLPFPDSGLELIIKVNTPWHIVSPSSVKFLMTPAFYHGETDFECTAGIIDPSVTNEIVIQMYWKKIIGSRTIKEGSPMAYLFPLTERHYDFICRMKDSHDDLWLNKKRFFQSFSFTYPKNKIQKIFKTHYRL
jgi:hypothetical protein